MRQANHRAATCPPGQQRCTGTKGGGGIEGDGADGREILVPGARLSVEWSCDP